MNISQKLKKPAPLSRIGVVYTLQSCIPPINSRVVAMIQVKLFRTLSTAIVILLTTFFSSTLYAADVAAAVPTATPSDTPVAQVIWVKGTVKAAIGAAAPRVLERRSPVYSGDVITTDSSGTGEIAFTDSSVVSLRASTEFKIDSYNYKPGGPPADSKTVMSLVKGGFRTITGAIPKANPDGYQVNTPVATIGVRGTDYSAYYSQAEGLITKIDLGKILIRNDTGQIELDKNLSNLYAVIQFHEAPKIVKTPPTVMLTGQPPLTPVAPGTIRSISGSGSGGTSGGGGHGEHGGHGGHGGPHGAPGGPQGTGGTGGTGPGGSHPGGTGTGPDGTGTGTGGHNVPTGPKTVSGFCIGLLQDIYRSISTFFS